MVIESLRVLMTELIDYAGLFPFNEPIDDLRELGWL